MSRFIPVLLVLIVCISCLVSPVSAESFDQLSMYNLLDYTSLNDDGSNTLTVTGDHTFVFNSPSRYFVGYVDILVTITGGNDSISASIARFSGADPSALNVDYLGNSLYRISGEILYFDYASFHLTISSSSQESRRYNFISFDVSPSQSEHYDLAGDMMVTNYYGSASESWSAGSKAYLYFPYSSSDPNSSASFNCNIRPYNAENYDYIFLSLVFNDLHASSISALWDDSIVPVHFLNSFDITNDFYYVNVVLDVSSISRTNGTDSSIPLSLDIKGDTWSISNDSYVFLSRCYGVVDFDPPSKFKIFISKLEVLFSSLEDKLDDIFGTKDPDVVDATDTQDEIDDLINVELIGAIDDWNDNIDIVESGYDSALLNATPPLMWLSSLADRIFSNMGWFGNIYFLVGLISVIMLILSKSGLARSVGRLRRDN